MATNKKTVLSAVTMKRNAVNFANKWSKPSMQKEEETKHDFIRELGEIVGLNFEAGNTIFFEKHVGKGVGRIDAYIPDTQVIIEMKSGGIDLDKPQSGHNGLTPLGQALTYNKFLPNKKKANWIIISNYKEIRIYDMNKEVMDYIPEIIRLDQLPGMYKKLQILGNPDIQELPKEIRVTAAASKIVRQLTEELEKAVTDIDGLELTQYKPSIDAMVLKIITAAFCEDKGVWPTNCFSDLVRSTSWGNLNDILINLFKNVITPESKRDPIEAIKYQDFHYLNFSTLKIPTSNLIMNENIKQLILELCDFNWEDVSPTVCGNIFESQLDPEQREKNGMYYTPVEYINWCINDGFMNKFHTEFDECIKLTNPAEKANKLLALQDKLTIGYMDPACGSGNFLIHTFKRLATLENEILKELKSLNNNAIKLEIKVTLEHVYGIELIPTAANLAHLTTWMAACQMNDLRSATLGMIPNYLPDENGHVVPAMIEATIKNGDALTTKWETVGPKKYVDYLLANPPYDGKMKDDGMKAARDAVFKGWESAGFDFAACWIKLACDYMRGTDVKSVFLTTNSLYQAKHLNLWKPFVEEGIIFHFAYKNCIWNNNTKDGAKVTISVVGFSYCEDTDKKPIYEFNDKGQVCEPILVNNISVCLTGNKSLFPINGTGINKIGSSNNGCTLADGGNLVFTADEMKSFIEAEPNSKMYFRPYINGEDLSMETLRYYLDVRALDNATLNSSMPLVVDRMTKITEYRKTKKTYEKIAEKPLKPNQAIKERANPYIGMVEIGIAEKTYFVGKYLGPRTVNAFGCIGIEPTAPYVTALVFSKLHYIFGSEFANQYGEAVMYSGKIFNNFPVPDLTQEQKNKLTETARGILEARRNTGLTLGEMYSQLETNPTLLPLLNAHRANDRAVLECYGLPVTATPEEQFAKLADMHAEALKKIETEEAAKKAAKEAEKAAKKAAREAKKAAKKTTK